MLHVALLVLSLAASPTPSQQPQVNAGDNQQSTQHHESTNSEQHPTRHQPPALIPLTGVSESENHKSAQKPTTAKTCSPQPIVVETPTSFWSIAGTIVMALATITLAVVAILELRRMSQYVKDTRAIAEAAKQSAEAAAFSLHKLERPWIIIKIMKFEQYILDESGHEKNVPFSVEHRSEGSRLQLVYRIRNCGRSPARLTRYSAQFDVMPRPIPARLHYKAAQRGSESMIGPGDWEIQQHILDFLPGMTKKLFEREVDLVCFGYIEYRDVFSRKKHFTRFWFRLDFDYWRSTRVQTAFVFQGPPGWNQYT